MPCDYCHPDVRDHGFDMVDERAVYHVHARGCLVASPPEIDNPEGDEGDYDCSDDCGTVTIRIDRQWFECACGHGTDYRCRWAVAGPGGIGATCRSQSAAEAFVEAEWPDAERENRDDDGERWLRYAETGGMG